MSGPANHIDRLLDRRQETHGNFADVAYVAQHLKAAAERVFTTKRAISESAAGSPDMEPALQEAFDMIASKLGRIVAGDSREIDHWRDIAGYATLAVRHIEAQIKVQIETKDG